MKTLKEIHEGFFSNINASIGIKYKENLRTYIESHKNRDNVGVYISSSTIERVLEKLNEIADSHFDKGFASLDKSEKYDFQRFFTTIECVYINPNLFDSDISELPEWFNIQELWELNDYRFHTSMRFNIMNMPNFNDAGLRKMLDPWIKKGKVGGLTVTNCPKIKSLKGLPSVIGKGGLRWRPDTTTTYTYIEILKYFKNVEGPLEFNRKENNYEERVLAKAKANAKPKASKSSENLPTDNGKTEPKVRTKITKWTGKKEEAPIWTVTSSNKVISPDGIEFGRMTRDWSTVYRMTSKAMFVKEIGNVGTYRAGNLVGYAYDKNDNLICRLIQR